MNRTIAYIIPACTEGGAEIPVISQINYLNKLGWRIYLIILSEVNPALNKIDLEEDRLLILEGSENHYSKKSIKQVIKQLPKIFRFIRQNKIDILVAVMNLSHLAGRFLKLGSIIYGIKLRLIVYHQTSFYDTNPADTLLKKGLNLLTWFMSCMTIERSIFISEHVKNIIIKKQCVRQNVILYNTILESEPDTKSAKKIFDEWRLNRYDFKILVPGRLHPVKGHRLLFEAVAELIRRLELKEEQLHVIVVGSGWYLNELIRFSEKYNLTNRISFIGQVPNQTLLALHQFIDLLVIPSLKEPLGNVAIEGLRTGTMTIASDAGGLKEIINHEKNGLLFKAGDSMDLLEKINDVREGRVKIRKKDITLSYESKFTLENQIKKLLHLLQK